MSPSSFRVGYHCSHEQHAPSRLLSLLQRAEAAGFRAAMCSDHFHPWLPSQGHSGHSWAWLGAALQRTSLPLGVVAAPGQRQHPALVAQAIGTLAEMAPGRVWVALGSGEALNESITGDPWPSKPERARRLRASVDVIRRLLSGEEVSVDEDGVTVRRARLFTRPPAPVPLLGAALSKETAAWCGEWADGLITAGTDRDELRQVVEAFREVAGPEPPILLQAQHCWHRDDRTAARLAHEAWRHCALPRTELADLQTPEAFERATSDTRVEDVVERVRVSSDLARHRRWIEEDREMGFAATYVHQVAGDQEAFLDAFGREVVRKING